jgi:hypothetical protein
MPLWEIESRQSPVWPKAIKANVLNIHELAAGKLNALLERDVSRDLFDSHQLLTKWPLDAKKIRLAFTVYAGMRKQRWQDITVDNITFSVNDIRDKLVPVLKESEAPDMRFPAVKAWASKLMEEYKAAISVVLPFNKVEQEFLECLQRHGEIRPELISDDQSFCERVSKHPLLHWRMQQAKTE